jgi:sugar phosphate isomerase/epimerase
MQSRVRIAITAAPGQPRPAPLLLFGDIADAFRQAAGFGCQGVEIHAASEIGAPNLKLLADTFHMNIEEADMPASLKAAGSLVGHVHLADTNRQAPGHGHLDVAAVLKTLDAIGYQGHLSFEVLPLPTPAQAIRDGMDAIHAAIESDQE